MPLGVQNSSRVFSAPLSLPSVFCQAHHFLSSALRANGFWSEPILYSQSEDAPGRPDVDVRRRSCKHFFFNLPVCFLFPFHLFSFTRRRHKAAVMNRENVTPKV